MLACPKCGHDNDIGRIFCVKCGEKLEISKVGAPTGVKRMTRKAGKGKPMGKVVGFIVGKLFKVAALAAAAAFFSVVMLPPRFESKGYTQIHLSSFQEKRAKLEEAVNSQAATTLAFTEAECNSAMAQAVGNLLKAQGETKGMRLESIYISFTAGKVTVTAQQKWKWYRLTSQLRSKPDNRSGKWVFMPDAAWVGRFRIPPQANDKISDVFANLLADLKDEKKWLESFQSVEIKPGQMILTTKGADAPSADPSAPAAPAPPPAADPAAPAAPAPAPPPPAAPPG